MVEKYERVKLFDGFSLDLGRGCLSRAGEEVHLRPQTYEVLKYLVEHRGYLISKDRLIEAVWQGRAVTDGSLGKCIEELRDALGPKAKKYIRNVRGRGYILDTDNEHPAGAPSVIRSDQVDFVRVVVEEEEEVSDLESVAPANLPEALSLPRRRRSAQPTMVVAALALGLATIVLGAYWLLSLRKSNLESMVLRPFSRIEITRLTTSGKITHGAISPDGNYVAYAATEVEGNSIWVRHIAAPSSVRVAGPAATEYGSVTFAPDGNSIYYVALDRDKGDTTLYRVPVLGGPSTRAAYDTGPVDFSPDGKQIAFVRPDKTVSRLLVANADGTNERPLATRQLPDFFWAIWQSPAWSPDGKTIACKVRLNDERGQYETVMGVTVADGSQKPLSTKRWHYTGQPAWLGDGRGLLVAASESSTTPVQVWYVALKSGEATRITNDLNDYRDLSLTADSSKLVAVQDHSVSSIWVAPGGDLSRAQQVATDAGWITEMAWTPDGRIVYRSNAGGGADIWLMNADGSNAKQLTTDARASRGLTVSPDGRHIFFSSDRTGHFNIWRVDSDGANLKQLTTGESEFYPDVTPDGRWVVYQRGELEPRLWRVSTDGGQAVQLTETRAQRPAVSADGELVAYHYLDPDVARSRWRIGVVSSKGGPRLKQFDLPPTAVLRVVRWSPDQQAIVFPNTVGGVSDLWVQPLAGPLPNQLTSFNAEQIIAFDWSRDGRSLAFVRGVETSDVVLIAQAPTEGSR